MILSKKRLAIQLFGHIRTFEQTFPYFWDNIVKVNMENYEIDIFIHTWDKFSAMGKPNTERYELNKPLCEKKLTIHDINMINKIYQPKGFMVEEMKVCNGSNISIEKVNQLREKYEAEMDIKYDQILYIRPDILPLNPLNIDCFLKVHEAVNGGVLNGRYIYCASSGLDRLPIITADNGMGVGECDLIWFCNFSSKNPLLNNNATLIPIRYLINYNFLIWRYLHTEQDKDFFIRVKNKNYKRLWREHFSFSKQIQNLELEIQTKTQELTSKTQQLTQTKNQLVSTKQQLDSKVKQLDSKTKELESKNKILESNPNTSHLIQNASCFKGKLAYLNTLTTAKDRIHNHLSYKLGQAMIENSKSLLGYIRMPYVLSYIKDKHKQEQQQYQEAIKKNPNLKLPNLESYPDYKESLKEKECLTYKLGEAFIKASKTWYKGGYVKLWFEVRRLKGERK